MMDLHEMYERFSELRIFVASEPRLAAFAPAAHELQRQAASIVTGERAVPPFQDEGEIPIGRNVPLLSDEDVARALLKELAKIPSFEPDEDPLLALAYGTLLRNVTVSMMRAIFAQYPHIVPSVPVET
jgi:hypothetical protein